jgi:hypothetical protein
LDEASENPEGRDYKPVTGKTFDELFWRKLRSFFGSIVVIIVFIIVVFIR